MIDFVQSASQLAHVESCVRSAALHYIDKIKVGSDTSSRELGTRVHAICRAYVQHGTEPDLTEIYWKPSRNPRTGEVKSKPVFPGQIAAAAFPLLRRGPHGVEKWYCETKIDGLRLPSGVPLRGDIDLAIAEGARLEIRDYKTTSDFCYALQENELLGNIQANLYAYAGFAAIDAGTIVVEDKDTITLHWQYLLTKGKAQSHSVRVEITRAKNKAYIEILDRQTATPWVQIRRKKIPGAQLPPTGLASEHCNKFLGCPYRGTAHCVITLEDQLRYSGGNVTDLAALLASKLQSQQTLAQVTPPTGLTSNPFAPVAPVRPSFWMPGDTLSEVQEYLKSKGKPLSVIAMAADNAPPAEVANTYDTAPKVEAGTFNPPESAGMVPAANPTIQAHLQPAIVAPSEAAETSAQAGEFAALKARAQGLGLLPEGKNLKTAGIKRLLAEHDAKGAAPALSNPFAAPVRAVENVLNHHPASPEAISEGQIAISLERLRELENCERIAVGLRALVEAFRA